MKIQTKIINYTTAALATGIEGGGRVTIKGGYYPYGLGTVEMLDNTGEYITVERDEDVTFYLNEGESLYASSLSSSNVAIVHVIYHNQEPSTQKEENNTPMNFTGSITLSQN